MSPKLTNLTIRLEHHLVQESISTEDHSKIGYRYEYSSDKETDNTSHLKGKKNRWSIKRAH